MADFRETPPPLPGKDFLQTPPPLPDQNREIEDALPKDMLSRLDAEMDSLYKKHSGDSASVGKTISFEDAEGDGSTDFQIRRRTELAGKYGEYTQRLLDDPRNSEGFKPENRSDWYKREIARRVIVDGQVSPDILMKAIEEKFGELDIHQLNRFINAQNVVRDYINTGGRSVHGGTGLPNFTQRR